jgi:hypothetical protein
MQNAKWEMKNADVDAARSLRLRIRILHFAMNILHFGFPRNAAAA